MTLDKSIIHLKKVKGWKKLALKTKKKFAIGAILVAIVFTVGALAQSFFFIFNLTAYFPTQYDWQEPWEIKERVDFVEATLNITGPGYEGESHNVELTLKNVATESNYVITDMDYAANWTVGTDSEVIIEGSYSGALLVGENVTYSGSFTPTLVGAGNVEMFVSNIVWVESDPITWTTDTVITGTTGLSIESFEITGATMSKIESGVVSFRINAPMVDIAKYDYKVEVVELNLTIAEGSVSSITVDYIDYSFTFDPLEAGGAYTMQISVDAH